MKPCCVVLVLSCLVLTGGCLHRSKKPPTPEIATEVEENFRQRWIAKRMSELQAQGVSDPREARLQAAEEFKKKWPYIKTSTAPDPMTGAKP